jgi:hypothetical protein
MEKMLFLRVRLTGALTAGKWTSILFIRLPEAAWWLSTSAGVAALLVRGVVYPLPKEGLTDVKTAEESDMTLDALRLPPGLFDVFIVSGGEVAAEDMNFSNYVKV